MNKPFYPLPDKAKGQIEYERDLLFHVNNVLHDRVNFMLVAESIFFAGLAQVWQITNAPTIKVILCALGIILTSLLWQPLTSLKTRSDFLTEHLRKTDTLYNAYLDKEPLRATARLVCALPLVFFCAWILVLLVVLEKVCFFTGPGKC